MQDLLRVVHSGTEVLCSWKTKYISHANSEQGGLSGTTWSALSKIALLEPTLPCLQLLRNPGA